MILKIVFLSTFSIQTHSKLVIFIFFSALNSNKSHKFDNDSFINFSNSITGQEPFIRVKFIYNSGLILIKIIFLFFIKSSIFLVKLSIFLLFNN